MRTFAGTYCACVPARGTRLLCRVAVAVCLLLPACDDRDGGARPPGTDPTESVPAVIDIDLSRYGQPVDVAVGAGAVWATVTDPDGGALVKIDPRDNEVVASLPLENAHRIATTNDAVWVTTRGIPGSVVRIDPNRARAAAKIRVRGGGLEIAANNKVWVTRVIPPGSGRLFRINPATDEVDGTVDFAGTAFGVAADERDVWTIASNGKQSLVLEIDPRTAQIIGDSAIIPHGAQAIDVGEDAVWVTLGNKNEGPLFLQRLGRASVTPATRLRPVGKGRSALTVGEDSVWVWIEEPGELRRLDPATAKAVQTISVDMQQRTKNSALPGIALGYDAVWLTGDGTVHRVEP